MNFGKAQGIPCISLTMLWSVHRDFPRASFNALESCFNQFFGFRPATWLKETIRHRCFPDNLAKLAEHLFYTQRRI